MGGVLILIAILVPTVLWSDPANLYVWVAVLSTLAFGAIGFADDYLKVVKRRSLGLTFRQKIFFQALAALMVAAALVGLQQFNLFSTRLTVPFIKQWRPDLLWHWWPATMPHLAILAFIPFVLFVMFVLVGSSNAVNLTDGLDGLAIGCTIIAARRACGADLRERARGVRRLSGTATHGQGGRADDLLRVDGGRVDRFSLV